MKLVYKNKPSMSDLSLEETRLLMQDIIDILLKKNVVKLKDFKDKSQSIIKRMQKEDVKEVNNVPI